MSKEQLQAEVVVVGAGLSGLTSARRLAEQGVDVAVIEAKDRVGGRVARADLVPGKTIELGGRFTGPGMDDVFALAQEVGVDRFDAYMEGDAIWCYDGEPTRFDWDAGIPLSRLGEQEYRDALGELDRLARTVNPAAPWEAPRARQLDLMTFETWLEGNFTDSAARHALALDLVVFFSTAAVRTSMLHVVSFIAAMEGGTDGLANGERFRFVGGPFEIAHRVAAALGDRVHVGHPVRWLDWSDAGVTVHAEALEIRASRAIIAMSPADAPSIEFRPILPPQRSILHKLGQGGGGSANMMVYSEPFWRDEGLSGSSVGNHPCGTWTRDCSPPDGSPGVIVTFMIRECPPGLPWGVPPEIMATEASRRQGMTEALGQAFGPKALSPIDYIEQDWHDVPFTNGCQFAMPPGLFTQTGAAFSDPIGPLHWSGTETAARYQMWMNGAVQSGERAASEVLARLGRAQPATAR